MSTVYKEDGVNIHEGDLFSEYAKKICTGSFENSPFIEVRELAPKSFRGPRVFRFKNVPADVSFDAAPDGIGTKVVAIDAANMYRHAAANLVAMTNGDITRWGGKGVVFINVLDVATLGTNGDTTNRAYRSMLDGLGEIARQEGFVCFRGETAELSACVGSENPDATAKFNWSGVMIGLYHSDRAITGDSIKPGHVIVGLREPGFRSNGLSSARKALAIRFGERWWENSEAREIIKEIARPATLYDRFLTEMNGWTAPLSKPRFRIHGIVHVTGGGMVDKLGKDILGPRGLSAELSELFPLPPAMLKVMEWRGIPEREAFQSFCCGAGVLVILDQRETHSFIKAADEYGIEARRVGLITSEQESELAIRSPLSNDLLIYSNKRAP